MRAVNLESWSATSTTFAAISSRRRAAHGSSDEGERVESH